jgi:hypothetical protein
MDRRKLLLVAVIMVTASLAITCVTAHSLTANTPLYILRMEQASSKMNFLPTAVNGFIYTAEKGYEVTYDTRGNCCINGYGDNANPLATDGVSCVETMCDPCDTYNGEYTCQYTCPDTCNPTCTGSTCPYTCHQTCPDTCPGSGPTCYWIYSCLIVCG